MSVTTANRVNAVFLPLAMWAAIVTVAVRPPGIEAAQTHIQLVDQRGTHFTFDDLRGSPVVLTFVSAHCSDACPLINAQIAQSVQKLGNRPNALRFLTVTLDPERDTALDMRKLAKEFEANPTRWIVASGNAADIHTLMRRFHVETRRNAQGYATTHTTFVYLLDSQLHVRRTLLASSDLGEQLLDEAI